MNRFLQKHNIKLLIGISIFVFLINALRFYYFPLVSTDSTWTLSSFYDYLKNPNLATSNYAHEYLGPVFNFNTLHYFLAPIFNVFELNTTNFIILHFCIILLTSVMIWLLINNKTVASIVILFYVLDGYIYGFRSESYNILLSTLMLLSWKSIDNQWFKFIICTAFIIFIGFIHPVGGIILGMTYLYLLIGKQEIDYNSKIKGVMNKQIFSRIIFSVIVTAILLVLFGTDKIENMYNAYLTPSGDSENHFDGLHLDLFLKYLLLGTGFWAVIFFFYWHKTRNSIFLIYILSIIAFLIVSGRSYYFPYLIIPVLVILENNENANLFNNLLRNSMIFRTATFSICLYCIGLTILKLGSAYTARHTGNLYRNILKISKEIVKAKKGNLVFIPSQLSIENAYESNQRIIFPSVRTIRKEEVPKGTCVLIFSSDQLDWIQKNPTVFGEKSNWHSDTLINFEDGEYNLASNFKERPTPINKYGLIKFTKIID